MFPRCNEGRSVSQLGQCFLLARVAQAHHFGRKSFSGESEVFSEKINLILPWQVSRHHSPMIEIIPGLVEPGKQVNIRLRGAS